MEDCLRAKLEAVTDPATFLSFVEALIADRKEEEGKEQKNGSSPYSPGANGWENGSIASYLEAAVCWAEDSGMTGDTDLSPWRTFADFLYAGKSYE